MSLGVVDAPAEKIMGMEVGDQGDYIGEQFMFPTNLWYWLTAANWSDFSQNHVPDASYRWGDCDQKPGVINWWGSCAQYPRYRHNGLSNFPYVDGHVKAMIKGKLDWYKDIYNRESDSNSFS